MSTKETFGAFTRREREAKQIGLRRMAKMIGVSPTYLSKVERDEFAPPAEDKVKAIAEIIGCNKDDLLARANRVASDITGIIKSHAVEISALLRVIDDLPTEDTSGVVMAMRTLVSWRVRGAPVEKEKLEEITGFIMRSISSQDDLLQGGRDARSGCGGPKGARRRPRN